MLHTKIFTFFSVSFVVLRFERSIPSQLQQCANIFHVLSKYMPYVPCPNPKLNRDLKSGGDAPSSPLDLSSSKSDPFLGKQLCL